MQIVEDFKDFEAEDFVNYIQSNFKNTTKGSLTLVCGFNGSLPTFVSNAFNLVLPLNASLDAFGVVPCIDLMKVAYSRQDGLVEKSNMANLALKVESSDKTILSLMQILNQKV